MSLKLTQNFFLKRTADEQKRITKVGVEFIITKEDLTYINNCCFNKDDLIKISKLDCFIGFGDNFYLFDILENDIKQPIGFIPFNKKDNYILNNDLKFYVKSKEVLNYFNKKELDKYRRKYRRIKRNIENLMIRCKWECLICGCDEFNIIEGVFDNEAKGFRLCKYCGNITLSNI